MIPKVKNKIFLAPMEEINDPSFRMICKKAGCGLTWTALTSPLNQKQICLDDKPVLQIFANDVKGINTFMNKYDHKVFGWDFNLGCPAKTAKNHKFGSYLTDLTKIEKIVKLMRENTKKPLSIKIRKSDISYDLLNIAEKYCDWIVIHPRTKNQGYSGEPDLNWAKEFKKKSKIPVVYSGNVDEFNYSELLKIFDYVMIGRNAIGRPEIFSKITNKKFKKNFIDYLNLAQDYKVPYRVIKFQAVQWTKGDRNSKKERVKISQMKSLEQLKEYFNCKKINL